MPPTATLLPAASLLLLTATNRILLLRRPRTSRSYPNAHVFPGGMAAYADTSLRMTALRETFEETGLLLTTTAPPASLNLRAMQSAVHANAAIFEEQIASAGLRLVDPTLLTPATTWITPPTYPRRFESRFFITSLLLSWIASYDRKPASILGGQPASQSQPAGGAVPVAPPTSGGVLDTLKKVDEQQNQAPSGPQAPQSQ